MNERFSILMKIWALPTRGIALALLAFLCPVARSPQAQTSEALTFREEFRSKMYIAEIPSNRCGEWQIVFGPDVFFPHLNILAVLNTGNTFSVLAAVHVFCMATSLGFDENPANGDVVEPLDARIRAGVTLEYKCEAGKQTPLAGATVTAGTIVGGHEIGGLQGIVNPIAIRNEIETDGSWGMVASGHPPPEAEHGFRVFRTRDNVDIWHKLSGVITCGTDADGNPTSNNAITLETSKFPSHKIWYSNRVGGSTPRQIDFVPQGDFSELWFLSSVPAP